MDTTALQVIYDELTWKEWKGSETKTPRTAQGIWDDPGRVKNHVDLEVCAATLLTAEIQE